MTFEEWMNRPVYKAQVHTARIAARFLGLSGNIATTFDHPMMLLRPLPPYRTAASLAFRKMIADAVRHERAAGTYRLERVNP